MERKEMESCFVYWMPIDVCHILGFLPIVTVVALVVTYLFLKLNVRFLGPLNYKKDMTTRQYCKKLAEVDNSLPTSHRLRESHEGQSKDLRKNAVNGWIPILESNKLNPGSIKSVIVFGKDLIVTRSDDGKQVDALEAFCPHLGANIAVGGFVERIDKESCVRCPFHGWSFRANDGKCVDIPYSSKKSISSQARLEHWSCQEVNNFIYLWHHSDGSPPNWDILPIRQIVSGSWTLAARSLHKSYMDISDFLENGADYNHFSAIHEDLLIFGNIDRLPAIKFVTKYIKHFFEVLQPWKPVLDNYGRQTHMAKLKLRIWLSLFGYKCLDVNTVATQIGPLVVHLHYRSKLFGEGVLIMNGVPVGGRLLKYYQHVYSDSSLHNRLMARAVLWTEARMLERDMLVWNHKKHTYRPTLVPEDKIIKQFRMWYAQFYRKKITISYSTDQGQLEKCNGRTSKLEF